MKLGLAVLGLGLLATNAGAAESVPWLHVRVEEPGKETKVNVNLPLSVVEAALKAAPEKVVSDGQLHLGPRSRPVARRPAPALEGAARDRRRRARVGTGTRMKRYTSRAPAAWCRFGSRSPAAREQVHVDLPVTLVDALLSGEGETVDLAAALVEVRKLRGDIVQREGRRQPRPRLDRRGQLTC